MEASSAVTIRHPNREKAESKATKAIVVLLLIASAGLVLLITAGGWTALQGAQFVAIAAIIIYLLMAYYVARWNRGVLPVAAALAILTAVLAAIAAPAWFDRDKPGLNDPAIPPAVLGTLCIVLVGVSLLLIAFAMRAFAQNWHVEVEEGPDAAHPQAV
jgi:lysylphosphatidylglycerol synthetase-like protein (DUF2156 family)